MFHIFYCFCIGLIQSFPSLSFPAETFTMDFNHLKPVLDDRAVPEGRQHLIAGERKQCSGPLPPLLLWRQRFVLDDLHGNSFLLLSLLCRLGDFSTRGSLLLNRFYDAHSHSLPHVTHSKAACEWRMDTKRALKAIWLRGQWWLGSVSTAAPIASYNTQWPEAH